VPLNFEIISNPQLEKDRLITAWKEFNGHQIPEGFTIENILKWWERYVKINNQRVGYDKECKIILVYNDKKLKAILPLMKVVRIKFKYLKVVTLEFLTQSFTDHVLDIIHNDLKIEEVKETFLFIKKSICFDYLNLSYLNEDSVLIKCSADVFLHAGKVIIPLQKDYETIRKDVYSKNLRHILNKFNRRIAEDQNSMVTEVIEGAENIRKIKNDIIEVSLSKLLEDGMHSLYQNSEFADNYFDELLKKQRPFCSVYFYDNKLVAYNLGYIKDDIVYALDAAYNRVYADAQKIGLGILAYDRIVEMYAGRFNDLDMGFGLDDYKFRFSKKVVFTKTLIMKGNTVRSLLFYKHSNNKLKAESERLMNIAKKYSLVA